MKTYEVWVEIAANKEFILDAEKFENVMEKCNKAGMTGVILSVKDTTGFAIYPGIAPHYSIYDPDFRKGYDYVEQCFRIIRAFGMKCYGAFDVFAGGDGKRPMKEMPALSEPGFACEVYGVDDSGKAMIRTSIESAGIHTAGSIDDFGEIFLNPGNYKVRDYAKRLVEEFVEKYHPDGVVLDRVRYVGLSTDFSNLSREQWETYSGIRDEKWPEDIYMIVKEGDEWKEKPGRYFGSFLTYRMQVIHDFVEEISRMIHRKFPGVEFCDYTGSWYPLYYKVGANWADESYDSDDFPWCKKELLQKTAYAGNIDVLLSGCYYADVTIEEAREGKQPAEWYSVEGAVKLALKAAGKGTRIVAALFLDQYKEMPEKIPQAITMCMEHSEGCMLFDLSYLEKNNWWKHAVNVYAENMGEKDLKEVTALCERIFPKEYHVTERRIRECVLEDNDYNEKCSFCIRRRDTGELIGFSGVKVSRNKELYPDTGWISVCGVATEYQGAGYGTLLLKKTLRQLRKKNVETVYLGQDITNLFSGIPVPEKKKVDFFKQLGFTLNMDEHYDLEGSLKENDKLRDFDESRWIEKYKTDIYQDEKEKLLCFLRREFPGRWEFETKEAIKSGKDPREIILLTKKDSQEIEGFCMISIEKENGIPTGRGGLGPIGISKTVRGNHIGVFLLYRALCQLKELGADIVNIDWTILKDFYGQLGFTVVRTYRAASISIKDTHGS